MNGKSQSGFSIVEVIIAVLVIGTLGFIGWRVYNSYSIKPTAKVSSQTNSQTTQTIDPNAGYFVIKEWGVRFKPATGLTGLQYVFTNAKDDPSDSYADFITSQLASMTPRCDPASGNGFSGLGRLSRYPQSSSQPITGIASKVASFNGYNYYLGLDEAECIDSRVSANATAVNLLNTEKSEFIDSVKSIEEAKGTYLDIKELGIKILLNDQISDAVYAPYHNPPTDVTKAIGISAQSLINSQTDSKGYCDASGGAIGVIAESPTPFLAPPQGTQTLAPDGKTILIGNNYYRYVRPQNDSCAVGPVTTDMVEAKISAFEQAVTTLQSDN